MNPFVRQHLRWLWLAACLALTGFFVYRGLNPPSASPVPAIEVTPVANFESSQIQSTPIEQIRIGERVAARNPLLEEQARLAPEPDESWRWLSLHLDDDAGKQVDIQLLRPAYWVQQQDAYVGGFVFLELCELGAYGNAQVINIQPAPVIAAGEGRVVTGTFRHTSSAPLYDVVIEGESEPIGVTAHHPFWSEDRQDFIPTEELQVGERLLAREGESCRVISLLPRPGPEVVYNLEVHREHVYQVASQGLLVHNCSGATRTGYGAFGWGEAPRTGPGQFTRVVESMSDRAARYQSRITGRLPDVGYVANGVKFDGFDDVAGVLLDAKGPGYASFVRNGRFQPWYRGGDELVDQARRQVGAANGSPIRWHVAEQEAADAMRSLLQRNGIQGINVVHTP